jgi:hypothetical protein
MMLDYVVPSQREWLFRRILAGYWVAAEQHQNSIAGYLDGFKRTGSGRALLTELGRTGRGITVMPHWLYFMALPGEGFGNATPKGLRAGQDLSHVTDGFHANYGDIFGKGAPIPDSYGGGGEIGTGKGASVVLYYSAGTWTDVLYTDYSTGEAGFQPDEVLFHELAHVSRMLRGRMTAVPIQGRPNFHNIEEYFATLIANIYISEKGQDHRLRGAYAPDDSHPDKGWSVMKNPGRFYLNDDGLSMSPHQLMETFERTQKEFYHDLAVLPTPPKFNPPRVHFNTT